MSKSCPIYKVNLGTFVPTNQMYIFSGNTLFGIKYVCGLRECAFNVGAAATCQPEVHQGWSGHKSNITADRRKEGRKKFNDALNTFYLRNKIKGNPLPPHGILFHISSYGYFICTILQTAILRR